VRNATRLPRHGVAGAWRQLRLVAAPRCHCLFAVRVCRGRRQARTAVGRPMDSGRRNCTSVASRG